MYAYGMSLSSCTVLLNILRSRSIENAGHDGNLRYLLGYCIPEQMYVMNADMVQSALCPENRPFPVRMNINLTIGVFISSRLRAVECNGMQSASGQRVHDHDDA